MPATDVFMMLEYYKLKSYRENNMVDIDDVSEEQFSAMIGAEKI